MGIKAYKHETSPGVFETLYLVTAEAINKYTGKRIQMKRRGISSKPKAERTYRELWSACRDLRSDGANVKTWGELVDKLIDHLENNRRSIDNLHGYSLTTILKVTGRLKHVQEWNDTHLDLITHLCVSKKLDELEQKGMSRALANCVLKEVKRVMNFAVEMGAIKVNPLARMRLRREIKKRKEALTHEESNYLLSEAKSRNHPYFYIWLLTLSLGLRRSELAGLRWMDIDFEHRLIYLQRQKTPKEGVVPFLKDKEDRIVAIPDYVIPELKKLKLSSQTDFVIEIACNYWEKGLQAMVIRKFCREIGIKEITHHQLRATHITLALVDGIPLGIVKENVGHAKLSTTDVYFRSAGINMKGQTDGLRLKVPTDEDAKIFKLPSPKK